MPPPHIPTAEEKQAAIDQAIVFTVYGRQYIFRPSTVSSRDELDYRRATGFSYREILSDGETSGVGAEQLAIFMWLARRQAGERELPYDAVGDTVSYTTVAEAVFAEEVAKAPDAGEVPAADSGGTFPSGPTSST